MTSDAATDGGGGGDASNDVGHSLSLNPKTSKSYTLLTAGDGSKYMSSPNGLYSVDGTPLFTKTSSGNPVAPSVPLLSANGGPVVNLLGPNGQKKTITLPKVDLTKNPDAHIDIGNDGTLTVYSTTGTKHVVKNIPSPSSWKATPGTIVNSTKLPPSVHAAIENAQSLTQQLLGDRKSVV